MKKANGTVADEMRSEYKRSDFGTLVRGKHAQRLRESSNVVVIEPDLGKAFPTARAVNTALRRLLRKPKASADRDTTRPEDVASRGGRGKTAARYREGINIVLLDSDVSAGFANSEVVNKALRTILDAMPARQPKRRR
jgi:hypothetical protein